MSCSSFARAALKAGAGVAGAYASLSLARWLYRSDQPAPVSLPLPVDLDARPLETPEGRAQCYVRPGSSPPLVVLHSINAVGSTVEMKPIVEHLAAHTDRTIYAMDWLGFGRSDRPAIEYTPTIYERQLYTLLRERAEGPADVIALSLGCEYAARVALSAAPHVRRLLLISPTGLGESRGPSSWASFGLAAAGASGAFELAYARLTRRSSLRTFYERQVFLEPDAVPDSLVDYGAKSARIRGAHRAPLKFLAGALFTPDVARRVYRRLYRPTLILHPQSPNSTIQSFDTIPALCDANPRYLNHEHMPGGLMPQWEEPASCFRTMDSFLEID